MGAFLIEHTTAVQTPLVVCILVCELVGQPWHGWWGGRDWNARTLQFCILIESVAGGYRWSASTTAVFSVSAVCWFSSRHMMCCLGVGPVKNPAGWPCCCWLRPNMECSWRTGSVEGRKWGVGEGGGESGSLYIYLETTGVVGNLTHQVSHVSHWE